MDEAGVEEPDRTKMPPDEIWFWESRRELGVILGWALARRCCPWALFGAVLVQVSALVPYYVVLPPLVSRPAALNLYLVVVGEPGDGKSVAEIAQEVLPGLLGGRPVFYAPPGSGEGVMHAYQHRARPERGEDGPGRLVRDRDAAVFETPETELFKAVGDRSTSTLNGVFNAAWTGGALGFLWADPAKRLPLERLSYRLCAILQMQPDMAPALLDRENVGTPQRFVFMPATAGWCPEEAPECPPPLEWDPPAVAALLPQRDGRPGLVHMEVEPGLAAEVRRMQKLKQQRQWEGSKLDSHLRLSTEKIAACFAWLQAAQGRHTLRHVAENPLPAEDGSLPEPAGCDYPEAAARTTVAINEEDVRLARFLMARSVQVRGELLAMAAEKARAANAARGRAEAERDEARDNETTRRCATAVERILCGLAGGWMLRGDLRKKLRANHRACFDAAISHLLALGRIEREDVEYHGQKGERYRLAGDSA
jgi:hypothetical protein